MRRRVLVVATAAALVAGPSAAAQVIAPPGGDVDVGHRTGRTPRTERIPGTGRSERIPGTGRSERIPGTGRTERIPGTGRTPGTARIPRPSTEPDVVRARPGAATRLPVTGSPIATVALDGVTLLGAGALLLRFRRRLLA